MNIGQEIKTGPIGIVPARQENPAPLSPLDDKDVWRDFPAYSPPLDVDVEYWQKRINSPQVAGTTRDGKPIIKLVWNGDKRYWHEFYTKWNTAGQPVGDPVRRPRLRYKILRDEHGAIVRDVFPPRWVLLARLEPEQYAASWAQESRVFSPDIGQFKLIRPDIPPPVYWMWYQTVAEHNTFCCVQAQKQMEKCYGKYAPPSEQMIHDLAEIMAAQRKQGLPHNPFGKVSMDFVRHTEEEFGGYRAELQKLQCEQEIYIENPLALLGIAASIKADVSYKKARQIVKEFYDRQLQEAARKIK